MLYRYNNIVSICPAFPDLIKAIHLYESKRLSRRNSEDREKSSRYAHHRDSPILQLNKKRVGRENVNAMRRKGRVSLDSKYKGGVGEEEKESRRIIIVPEIDLDHGTSSGSRGSAESVHEEL